MRQKLTFANVMSVIAVFIALGGVGYAATKLAKNSVGTKQLKKSAVTGVKVKDNAITGAKVQDGSIPTSKIAGLTQPGGTIGSGVTLRGTFSPTVNASSSTSVTAGEGVSFGGYRLPARPLVNVIPPDGAATAACPGSSAAPEAASGNLCVYVVSAGPANGQIFILDPVLAPPNGAGLTFFLPSNSSSPIGDGKISVFGFSIAYAGSATGPSTAIKGTWAVTG